MVNSSEVSVTRLDQEPRQVALQGFGKSQQQFSYGFPMVFAYDSDDMDDDRNTETASSQSWSQKDGIIKIMWV